MSEQHLRGTRVLRRVATSLATIGVALGVLATPASADASGSWETSGVAGVSAWGTFKAGSWGYEIDMNIKDTKADGHAAGVLVQWVDNKGAHTKKIFYHGGAGNVGKEEANRYYYFPEDYLKSVSVAEFISEQGKILSLGSLVRLA